MKKIYGLFMLITVLSVVSCTLNTKEIKYSYSAFTSTDKVEKEPFLAPKEEYFVSGTIVENLTETDCLSYWCKFFPDEDQTYYFAYWTVAEAENDYKLIEKVEQMKSSTVEVFYLEETKDILNAVLKVSDCPYYRYKLSLKSGSTFKLLEVGNYFKIELKAKQAVYFKITASALDCKIVSAIYEESQFLESLQWNKMF